MKTRICSTLTYCAWALLFMAPFVAGMVPREPIPEVYSSFRGKFIVRVEPGKDSQHKTQSRALARIFEFDAKKEAYEPRATFSLENEVLPEKVHITEDGSRIVVVGDWFDQDYRKPVIVIHDASGAVLKRFHLNELLSPQEIDELRPHRGELHWSAWKIDTNLMLNSNELSVMRDRISRGPSKKYDNFFIDLKTFKLKKETVQ